jgi:hypothetical protein
MYNNLVMPVMVGERCRTKTGIQDAKNEYTGLQTHTGDRIRVRYDGRNDNVNFTLASVWPELQFRLSVELIFSFRFYYGVC